MAAQARMPSYSFGESDSVLSQTAIHPLHE
jgi:hypothetical protein